MRFLCDLDGGQLKPCDPIAWRRGLSQARPGRFVVDIKRERKGRSLDANAYYWGVVLEAVSDWSGHDPEELHEYFKGQFLAREVATLPNGRSADMPPSTAGLDTHAFYEYVERVRRWAAENGLYVPDPNEPPEVRI